MQQINLLNGELVPEREPLKAQTFLLAWAGFAGLLLAITAWHGVSLWDLKSEMAEAESSVQRMRQANAAQRANIKDPADLRAQVTELQVQQAEQTQLVALLRAQQETQGFSPYLAALGRARVKNLWLSEIAIAHGGRRQMTLKGAALDASDIPKLLKNLAHETQFSGQRFEQIDVTANEETQVVEFAVVSPQGGA